MGRILENYRMEEPCASRNYNVGDRVRIRYKHQWYSGTIFEKETPERAWMAPYVLVKTDEQVDSDPNAYLEGFGIRGQIDDGLSIQFENEDGTEAFNQTYIRDMTLEEIEFVENPPF